MPRREKPFDCVEMKNAIQERLLAEQEGLSDEEVHARARRKLESLDTPLGQMWRSLEEARASRAR